MAAEIRVETLVAAPPNVVFDLARDVDAHVGSQDRAHERAVAGVTSGLIGLDQDVTGKATHFGLPFRMTSRVTAFERPHRFVDEQTSGPFGAFWHEHAFGAEGDAPAWWTRSASPPRPGPSGSSSSGWA